MCHQKRAWKIHFCVLCFFLRKVASSLSCYMESDLPTLVPRHLWEQRGSRGRQALGCVFLSRHKGTCCGFASDSGCGGACPPHPPRPMCEYVGLGQGFCGAEGPSAVPHNWCQAGTSSVGLIPVCPTQWTNSSYHTSHPVNTQPHRKEIMGHVCGRRDARG